MNYLVHAEVSVVEIGTGSFELFVIARHNGDWNICGQEGSEVTSARCLPTMRKNTVKDAAGVGIRVRAYHSFQCSAEHLLRRLGRRDVRDAIRMGLLCVAHPA